MEQNIELEKLQLQIASIVETPKTKPPRHRSGELFLKGPIPMEWLEKAGQQPGKALHVAVGIWFWAGIKKSRVIKLSIRKLAKLGVERHSAYRGLQALEMAGLVSVDRHNGRSPVVTLNDCTRL